MPWDISGQTNNEGIFDARNPLFAYRNDGSICDAAGFFFVKSGGSDNTYYKGKFDWIDLATAFFINKQNVLTAPLNKYEIGTVSILYPPGNSTINSLSEIKINVKKSISLDKWELFAVINGNKILISSGENETGPNSQINIVDSEFLNSYSGLLDLELEALFLVQNTDETYLLKDSVKSIRLERIPYISEASISRWDNRLIINGSNFGSRENDDIVIHVEEFFTNFTDSEISLWEDRLLNIDIPQNMTASSMLITVIKNGMSSNQYRINPEYPSAWVEVLSNPGFLYAYSPNESLLFNFRLKCLSNVPEFIYGIDTTDRILGRGYHKKINCSKYSMIEDNLEIASTLADVILANPQGGNNFFWFVCNVQEDVGNVRYSNQDGRMVNIFNLDRNNNLFYDCVFDGITLQKREYSGTSPIPTSVPTSTPTPSPTPTLPQFSACGACPAGVDWGLHRLMNAVLLMM